MSLMNLKCTIFECHEKFDIQKNIEKVLQNHINILPEEKDALILLKPNLNSDMCALTGNTTDLRILVEVIKFLKSKKYKNVVIGDGTSSGFLTTKINVISRLKIDKLSKKFGYNTLDLNNAQYNEVNFGNKKKIKIAKVCFDADLFINLPKIKTHAEAGISVCLKNMIGCVCGLDKQKVHDDLPKNILKLNEIIKPHLHIVDGLIAMEGTGPSRGIPKKMDLILSGTDPYLIDLVCTKIMELDYKDIPYLNIAEEKGLITAHHHEILNSIIINKSISKKFDIPSPNSAYSFIFHPKHRKYFIKMRYSPGFYTLFSLDIVSKILFALGIRQDMFVKKDDTIQKIYIDEKKCNNCNLCGTYCPLNIPYNKINEEDNGCINCLYCFFVCPKKAIKLEGDEGYLSYQIEHYRYLINNIITEKSII